MKLTRNLKGIIIALPILALAACTSGKDDGSLTGMDGGSGSGYESAEVTLAKLAKMNTFYFKYDNSEISPQYRDLLAAHAAYLKMSPSTKITIEGHADERGTPEYNIALGQRRADAVSNYLQALGVSYSQISTVSYGEERPIDVDSSAAAYAKNRRAVILY